MIDLTDDTVSFKASPALQKLPVSKITYSSEKPPYLLPRCFKCNQCVYITLKRSEFDIHQKINNHRKKFSQTIKCFGCDNSFNCERSIISHLIFDHCVYESEISEFIDFVLIDQNQNTMKIAQLSIFAKVLYSYIKNPNILGLKSTYQKLNKIDASVQIDIPFEPTRKSTTPVNNLNNLNNLSHGTKEAPLQNFKIGIVDIQTLKNTDDHAPISLLNPNVNIENGTNAFINFLTSKALDNDGNVKSKNENIRSNGGGITIVNIETLKGLNKNPNNNKPHSDNNKIDSNIINLVNSDNYNGGYHNRITIVDIATLKNHEQKQQNCNNPGILSPGPVGFNLSHNTLVSPGPLSNVSQTISLNSSPGLVTNFNQNPSPGLNSNFNQNPSPGLNSNFTHNPSPGLNSNFNQNPSPGLNSNFIHNPSPGLNSNFNQNPSPGLTTNFKQNPLTPSPVLSFTTLNASPGPVTSFNQNLLASSCVTTSFSQNGINSMNPPVGTVLNLSQNASSYNFSTNAEFIDLTSRSNENNQLTSISEINSDTNQKIHKPSITTVNIEKLKSSQKPAASGISEKDPPVSNTQAYSLIDVIDVDANCPTEFQQKERNKIVLRDDLFSCNNAKSSNDRIDCTPTTNNQMIPMNFTDNMTNVSSNYDPSIGVTFLNSTMPNLNQSNLQLPSFNQPNDCQTNDPMKILMASLTCENENTDLPLKIDDMEKDKDFLNYGNVFELSESIFNPYANIYSSGSTYNLQQSEIDETKTMDYPLKIFDQALNFPSSIGDLQAMTCLKSDSAMNLSMECSKTAIPSMIATEQVLDVKEGKINVSSDIEQKICEEALKNNIIVLVDDEINPSINPNAVINSSTEASKELGKFQFIHPKPVSKMLPQITLNKQVSSNNSNNSNSIINTGQVTETQKEDTRYQLIHPKPVLDMMMQSNLNNNPENAASSQISVENSPTKKKKSKIKNSIIGDSSPKCKVKKSPSSDLKVTRFKCPNKHCNIQMKNEENMQYHQKCHTNSLIFFCPECQTCFNNWRTLANHLWRTHQKDLELQSCDQCSFKCYSLSNLQNVHKLIHSDVKSFSCEICQKSFKNKKQLRNHKETHDVKEGNLRCTLCNVSLKNKRILREHMKSYHTEITSVYVCQVCKFATPIRARLVIHERQHTGVRPFKCTVCAFSTSDHNSLRRHKSRHTNETKYKCQFCDFGCIQSKSYIYHLKTVHPSKCDKLVFDCVQCNFQSLNEYYYQSHLARHGRDLNKLMVINN